MKLSELKVNKTGRIIALNCKNEDSQRLRALGIERGTRVKVLKYSCLKKDMLISAESVRVVLRCDIADNIETEIVF